MTDLERDYSPSSCVGGSAEPFIADYRARSAAAADALGEAVVTLADGSQVVTAPAGGDAPLLVFVHGGYWQALSAAASLYLAPRALDAGWSYAAVEYTIAPAAPLATMVDECRSALRAIAAAAPHSTLVLAGHSAGAHLAAMVAVAAEPPARVDALVLLSGVYDLRPLVHTTINEPLGMTEDDAVACSPLLLPVHTVPRALLAVGEVETDAFHSQTSAMAARLRSSASAGTVTDLVVPMRHHFDIVDDLVDPTTAVGAFVRRLGGTR